MGVFDQASNYGYRAEPRGVTRRVLRREEWKMQDSQVVSEWTAEARRDAEATASRRHLLGVLDKRFPGMLSQEELAVIASQDSPDLLEHWFRAALNAFDVEAFRAILLE